ncbi:MAG: outer membrane protein assembly factor BamA [Rhodospirillales bacterium]|nr:outer membrane protein assembly factor BamA [Rhodospirillales bacterium]
MKVRLGGAVIAAALVFLTTLVGPAFAQGGEIIREVQIEGTQRIEPETVRSYLAIQPGDPYDPERVDRSLKTLFATGLFADVTLRREGDALIVRVVENPIINRIAFEGNNKLDDETLQQEIQLRPRVVYTRTKVQSDVKRILDLYRRNARFAATVDPKVIPLEQNRVDLVFEIDEGPTTGIKGITFVGNTHFTDGQLREVIQTTESRWWRFLTTDDSYDPDRITYDRELLRRFYLSEGYAEFRVLSAVAELAPERDGFYVTYTLEEGERYKFGKIEIATQLKNLSAEELRPYLAMTEGDWYNADLVEKSINQITDAVGNRGFAFVDVRPRPTLDRENHVVDLVFDVDEGPRVYVERIDIVGNLRTLDKVIRREFRLVEGDAFNTSRLRRSQQRIRNLGFFKKVDVHNEQGSAPDKTVITVEVEEQSTGELSLGAGFSTTEGPLADISIRERNLLGRGQDLRAAFLISGRTQQLDLSFTEPYFLDRNVAAGFDLFRIERDNQDRSSFDQFSVGGAIRFGFQMTENLRETVRYTLRTDEITNVDSDASRFIRDQEGTRTTSAIGHTLFYDRRDNRIDPTEGYFASLSNDLAGLGGDARYIRTRVSSGYYYPVKAPDWVLSVTGEVGHIQGLGKDVAIQDRFFIGGDTLRGFETGGIGPRDIETGDALGGNTFAVGTVSLQFPLGLPQELGVAGRVFTDFGTLFNIDQSGSEIVDKSSLRASIGTGVSWKSPFGPIRVDFAVPVVKESFDEKELFRVSFGTRF